MFYANLDQYSGPLDKLLELILEKQLEITSLSLSAVTLDFLNYLKAQSEAVPPETLSDFLVVAAKLVLIKSKTLIPELELKEEEEQDIHDLEARLKLYREFSARSGGKAARIAKLWRAKHVMVGRPFLVGLTATGHIYPGEGLTVATLYEATRRLMSEIKAILPESRTVRQALIKLEDTIQELLLRCKAAEEHIFSSLSKNRPRTEIIALFLALLHLLKSKSISVRQDQTFSDIILRRI